MFSLLNTDCRVDLPNFILIPSYSIIAEYIYKHQNLATVNEVNNKQMRQFNIKAPKTVELDCVLENYSVTIIIYSLGNCYL